MDMDVEFNTTYSIYDVQQIDDYKLIKIHKLNWSKKTWKGDWSDTSPLWNKRLKKKFNFNNDDEDGNTENLDDEDYEGGNDETNYFYMSFDDFCNVFKYLYICKLINPEKGWTEEKYVGAWKKAEVNDCLFLIIFVLISFRLVHFFQMENSFCCLPLSYNLFK